MSAKKQKDPVDSVRNAATGYAAVVLGVICFLLVLMVTVAAVRLVAGGSLAATTNAQTNVLTESSKNGMA